MKHRFGLLLAVVAGCALMEASDAFTTVPHLVSSHIPSTTTTTRLEYNSPSESASEDAFRDKLNNAYQDWCQLHGRSIDASRKEIFCYHYLLAERFFQNTGVRLELNEHAHLTDQEYTSLLQQKYGNQQPDFKLQRPPAMEAEHERFQAAYAEWCQSNQKEMDESRLEIFSYHHLLAERYLEETGTVLQLNEFADRTQAEFEHEGMVTKDKQAEKESTATTSTTAQVATEEPQVQAPPAPETPPPQQQQQQQQQLDFRTKDWWDGSGGASNFADWWEGGSSLASARYERKPRSAKARWQQAANPGAVATPSPDTTSTTPNQASDTPANKDFWGFLGDDQQGSVAPAKPQDTTNDAVSPSSMTSYAQDDESLETHEPKDILQTPDSTQGSVSPSSMTSYAQDEKDKPYVPVKEEPPLSSNPTTTKDASSPSSMTSYAQDPVPDSRSPAAAAKSSSSTIFGKSAAPMSSNSADWWGSGSIAKMKPITHDTDMRENKKMEEQQEGSPGGESRAPRTKNVSKDETSTTAASSTSIPVESTIVEDTSSASINVPVSGSDDTTGTLGDSSSASLNVPVSSSDNEEGATKEEPKNYLDTLHPVQSYQGESATTISSIGTEDSVSNSQAAESISSTNAKEPKSYFDTFHPIPSYQGPPPESAGASSFPPPPKTESSNDWWTKAGISPTGSNQEDPSAGATTSSDPTTPAAQSSSEPTIPESSLNVPAEDEQAYIAWCQENGKEQTEARKTIFVRNLKWAREYSEQSGVELEMNEYADLTEEEFKAVLAQEEEEEGDEKEQVSEQPVLSADSQVKPLEVVSVEGDGAGPSGKSSVLTSRKLEQKRQKDMYEFQERLLAARIYYDLKLREQTKTLARQVAQYFFQRRLLAARIECDAKAKALEEVQTLVVEGVKVEPTPVDTTAAAQSGSKISDRVQDSETMKATVELTPVDTTTTPSDVKIIDQVRDSETVKAKQTEFKQELAKAKGLESEQVQVEPTPVETTPAQSDAEIIDRVRESEAVQAKQVEFQQKLLEARMEYDAAARKLLQAKLEFEAAEHNMEKAKKESEFQQNLLAERIKNDSIASQQRIEEATKVSLSAPSAVGDLAKKTKESTAASAATESASPKSDSKKVSMHDKLYGEKAEASTVAEPSATTASPVKSSDKSDETIKKIEASAATGAENAESVPSPESEDSSAVSISSTDELVFDYTSPYQGLTGPSKAGLVLAAVLAIGMVVTSPELDLASQVDWSQPGLTDIAGITGTAQHAMQDFVHNVQQGFAGATKSLSEGIHGVSQKFMGGLEGIKASTARSLEGMNQHIDSVKESTSRSLDGMGDHIENMKESTSRTTQSMSERMSPPKQDHTESLKKASNSMSNWREVRAQKLQEIGKVAAEKSTSVVKEPDTASNVKSAANAIKEVKQNAPSVVKEIKSSTNTVTNVVRELKQSPAASAVKEIKPSTAAKVIKDVAPSSSTDLKSMLGDIQY